MNEQNKMINNNKSTVNMLTFTKTVFKEHFRDAFRTQLNISDGAFLKNVKKRVKAANYFHN